MLSVSLNKTFPSLLHLPTRPLKTCFGLEQVPRCEPSTLQPIRLWLSHCAIGAGAGGQEQELFYLCTDFHQVSQIIGRLTPNIHQLDKATKCCYLNIASLCWNRPQVGRIWSHEPIHLASITRPPIMVYSPLLQVVQACNLQILWTLLNFLQAICSNASKQGSH